MSSQAEKSTVEPALNQRANPPIGEAAFGDVLAKTWIARELFLPLGRARWDGERYSLGAAIRKASPPP